MKANNLRFFNTLGRKKEEFQPIGDTVGFYSCGPTVYNFAHIGNLRTYIFNDILKRTLLFNKYKVKHVMNITDVGHLSGDDDSGEDKMLKGAKREKKSVEEIAEYYTEAFFNDIKELNILEPDLRPKATEHITDMIELIKCIENKGYAYTEKGNVYFDIMKFPHYKQLAGQKLEDMMSGVRIDVDENKKSPLDFALWFTESKFEKQEMKWDSPWGRGYPGWHIECSAMSRKYLGDQFDIHTGGIDHIPIHHTNEIAQTEACTGKSPWVRYWLHGEFLVIDRFKMAKSGENFITLRTLKDKGYRPVDYRYFCLTGHYRSQLTFNWESLDSARNYMKNLENRITELRERAGDGASSNEKKEKYKTNFINNINDDLNTPRALAVFNDMLKDNELSPADKIALAEDFDEVLGLGIKSMKKKSEEIPQEINNMLEQREEARKNKDFSGADSLRDSIKEKGWEIKDTPQGPKLRKK